MNRTPLFLAVGLLVFFFFFPFGKEASSGVTGTSHDLSMTGGAAFAYDTLQICVFCHTPHNANKDQKYNGSGGEVLNGIYLWNREVPGQAFRLYNSVTMNAEISQPGTVSLLCMSCHDGAGAMNVVLNLPEGGGVGNLPAVVTGTTMNQFGDAPNDPYIKRFNIGEAVTSNGMGEEHGTGGDDLTNDHPVGFIYNPTLAVADGGLVVPETPQRVDGEGLLRLFRGRFECSTCHNPHDDTLGAFLVINNTRSALCLACHLK